MNSACIIYRINSKFCFFFLWRLGFLLPLHVANYSKLALKINSIKLTGWTAAIDNALLSKNNFGQKPKNRKWNFIRRRARKNKLFSERLLSWQSSASVSWGQNNETIWHLWHSPLCLLIQLTSLPAKMMCFFCLVFFYYVVHHPKINNRQYRYRKTICVKEGARVRSMNAKTYYQARLAAAAIFFFNSDEACLFRGE